MIEPILLKLTTAVLTGVVSTASGWATKRLLDQAFPKYEPQVPDYYRPLRANVSVPFEIIPPPRITHFNIVRSDNFGFRGFNELVVDENHGVLHLTSAHSVYIRRNFGQVFLYDASKLHIETNAGDVFSPNGRQFPEFKNIIPPQEHIPSLLTHLGEAARSSGVFVETIFHTIGNKPTAELIDIFGPPDGGKIVSPLVYMSRGFQIYLDHDRASRVSFYRKGYRGSAGYEDDVTPGLRPGMSLALIESRFGLPTSESSSYGRWFASYHHIAPRPFVITVTYSHEYKTPEAVAESLSLVFSRF